MINCLLLAESGRERERVASVTSHQAQQTAWKSSHLLVDFFRLFGLHALALPSSASSGSFASFPLLRTSEFDKQTNKQVKCIQTSPLFASLLDVLLWSLLLRSHPWARCLSSHSSPLQQAQSSQSSSPQALIDCAQHSLSWCWKIPRHWPFGFLSQFPVTGSDNRLIITEQVKRSGANKQKSLSNKILRPLCFRWVKSAFN